MSKSKNYQPILLSETFTFEQIKRARKQDVFKQNKIYKDKKKVSKSLKKQVRI